jgi:PAS domain S-box-containing protein
MKLSINKTLFLAAILVLSSVAIIGSIILLQSRNVKDSSGSVSHTEKVLLLLQKVIASALDSETGSRGYIITGKQKFLEPLSSSEKNFQAGLRSLQLLVNDNHVLSQKLDSLSFYINKRIAFSRLMVKTRDESGVQAAVELVDLEEGKFYTDKIRSIGKEIEEVQSALLLSRQTQNNDSFKRLNIILYTILALVLLAGLYFIYYIKNNIDRRKKTQQELELLTRQIEDAHDAIYIVDVNRKIASWNRGAEKLYGYTLIEALGKDSNELLKTMMSKEEIDAALQTIAEEDHWTGELKRTTKNGEVIFVRSSTTTIRDRKGHISGYVSVSFNTSAQKKAEEELKRSNEELEEKVKNRTDDILKTERRFRSLIEHSSEGISLTDRESNLIYRSPAAVRITGNHPTDNTINRAHPDDLELIKQKFAEALQNPGVPVDYQGRFRHAEGHYYWMEGTLTNLLETEGINAMVANFRDITPRKLAEEKIIKSEERFRHTLDNMLEAAQLIGFDMKYIYVNDAASKQGKYTREQMIGQPVLELYPGFEQTELYKHFQKCMVERATIQIEQEFEFPDKTKNWFELSLQPVPEGIFILSVDITDRRQAEAKRILFSSIVNSSDDAIFSKSLEGNITSWNKGAETIFGYTADEIIGENIQKLLPVHLHKEEADITRKILTGEIVHHYETQRLKKDATHITISLSASPIRDENNIITGISTIARDITQENETKKRIIQSEENLKTIFDNTSEGFVLLDTHAIVKVFNKTAEKSIFSNTNVNLAIGKSIFDLIEPERELFFASVVSRVLQGETINYDRSYIQPNGTLSWIDYTYTAVYKENKITGICITARDTTEKKIADYHIKTSNERYETVAKATSDAIWDFDFETGKTFISGTGYQQLFGYPVVNDYSEENYWESHIHPDDKQRVLAELAKALADENKVQSASEYRFLKADGTYAYVNDRFFIIRENGKPKRMLGAKQDITEMKMAEKQLKTSLLEKQSLAERLSAIINTLPANIALLNKDGIVMDVNDAWRNFTDENDFIGNDCSFGDDYIAAAERSTSDDEHDAVLVSMGIQSVLTGKDDEFVFEYSCHAPAGLRWYRMVVAPLKEKEYAGAVVMHIDISELKRFEKERLQMEMDEQKKITRAMLQGQEKERNAIGEELHDNVNQILVSSNLMLSMAKIKQEKTDELISQAMGSIKEAIDENRKIAHFFVAPDLQSTTLAEQLEKLVATMIKAAGMQAFFHTAEFKEEYLGNEHKIHIYRIAQEQCTNIIKHSKATTVHITLSTAHDLFTMIINDDGVGMKPDQKIEGIGIRNINGRLGLFNGKASVRSAPGKGFTLEISFPI